MVRSRQKDRISTGLSTLESVRRYYKTYLDQLRSERDTLRKANELLHNELEETKAILAIVNKGRRILILMSKAHWGGLLRKRYATEYNEWRQKNKSLLRLL